MPIPEKTPLFTVIIPTKDRARYLQETLRTCSLQEYENLEVIVSDDGSTDSTRDVVATAAHRDPRIRYVTPGTVGMLENFEFALRQVRPGYVIALGGDDGLMPHGIRGMLDVLNETGQELLAWPAPAFYYPGVRSARGQLVLHRHRGRRIVRSRDFLGRQATEFRYVTDAESPMFYVKGVTSTRLTDKVRSRSADKAFYRCATPDGYSGLVLAGEVETYAFSGEPFSIYGASPTSQGMAYLASDRQAKKQSEAFYREVSRRPMHPQLASQPYSPLIALMTADYVLTTQDLPGWPGEYPALDYRQLLVKSLEELSNGLYGEDRLSRELHILNRIAELHGLGEFFRTLVKRTRRFTKKEHVQGNAVSRTSVFVDCAEFRIENIVDAAYFARFAFEMLSKVGFGTIGNALRNSLQYRVKSLRRGDPFPPEAEWTAPGDAS